MGNHAAVASCLDRADAKKKRTERRSRAVLRNRDERNPARKPDECVAAASRPDGGGKGGGGDGRGGPPGSRDKWAKIKWITM